MATKTINIRDLAEIVGARIDQVARAIKISTFNGVIRDTRVDTGRLRGNWQTSTGRMATSQIERVDKTIQYAAGGAAESEVSETVQGDTVDYLTNNLPYAEPWEERDGMIAKNIARIDRNIKEVLAK